MIHIEVNYFQLFLFLLSIKWIWPYLHVYKNKETKDKITAHLILVNPLSAKNTFLHFERLLPPPSWLMPRKDEKSRRFYDCLFGKGGRKIHTKRSSKGIQVHERYNPFRMFSWFYLLFLQIYVEMRIRWKSNILPGCTSSWIISFLVVFWISSNI